MALDENLDIMFHMALLMAKSRGGSPKYIVKEEPVVDKSLEIFECMPIGEGRTEYSSTGNVIPKEVTQGKGASSSYYILKCPDAQLVVCYQPLQ